MVGAIPVRRPVEVGGIDVGRQPLLEPMQLIGSAEVHLAGENGAIAAKPESVSEGRNVGCELSRIVVDPRARRQKARHERGARRRAQGARAIGAVEHDPVSRERLHVRRADEGMAVDGQERRRHLVGHDDENVGRFGGHLGILVRPSLSRRGRERSTFFDLPPAGEARLGGPDEAVVGTNHEHSDRGKPSAEAGYPCGRREIRRFLRVLRSERSKLARRQRAWIHDGLGHLSRLHAGRPMRFAPQGASHEFLRLRLRFLRQSSVEQHAARPLQGRGDRRSHARLLSPQHDRGIVSLVGDREIGRPYDGGDGPRRRDAAARPRLPRLHPSQGDRRSVAGSDGARGPGGGSAFGQCRTAG